MMSWTLSVIEMKISPHKSCGSRTGPGNDRSAGGGRRGFGSYALELALANVS